MKGKKFEYTSRSFETQEDLLQELDKLGEDGWELVNVAYRRGEDKVLWYDAWMKRIK